MLIYIFNYYLFLHLFNKLLFEREDFIFIHLRSHSLIRLHDLFQSTLQKIVQNLLQHQFILHFSLIYNFFIFIWILIFSKKRRLYAFLIVQRFYLLFLYLNISCSLVFNLKFSLCLKMLFSFQFFLFSYFYLCILHKNPQNCWWELFSNCADSNIPLLPFKLN